MEILIRNYDKKDLPHILELIKELAVFENAAEKVRNTVQQMEEEMDLFDCFIAENKKGEIVGMALFYLAYYTWVGKSMYLDDLIVKEQWRGNGIGTKLLNRVIDEAKILNCKRLRWQVLDWNEPAIKVYEKYGCDIDGEWLNCDISF